MALHQKQLTYFREFEENGAYYYHSRRLDTVVARVDVTGEATEAPELADALTEAEREELYLWAGYRVAGWHADAQRNEESR